MKDLQLFSFMECWELCKDLWHIIVNNYWVKFVVISRIFRISQQPNLIIVLLYIVFVLKKLQQTHHHKEPELILLLEIVHCVRKLQVSELSASRYLTYLLLGSS